MRVKGLLEVKSGEWRKGLELRVGKVEMTGEMRRMIRSWGRRNFRRGTEHNSTSLSLSQGLFLSEEMSFVAHHCIRSSSPSSLSIFVSKT